MKTYEAMFLLDAGNSDLEASFAPVRDLLARAQADVLTMKPWDDRRLAYKIEGRKRGLYVLTYFKADPSMIDELQHDIQLNDQVLRAMVLSADHVGDEQIQAETPATRASARQAAAEAQRIAREQEAAAEAQRIASEQAAAAEAESSPPAEQVEQADAPKDKAADTVTQEDVAESADDKAAAEKTATGKDSAETGKDAAEKDAAGKETQAE